MRRRSRTMLVAVLPAVLVAAAACGSSSNASSSSASSGASDAQTSTEAEADAFNPADHPISFANSSEAGGLDKIIGDGVRSAAEFVGFPLKSYNNVPDLTKMNPATTLQNLKLMIQDNPDLIIEYNPIQDIGEALGKQLAESGIPCIAVNNSIPGCHFFNLSNKAIGIDAANLVAPMMAERGWTGENTIVLLLQAAIAGTDINNSVRYFYTTLADQVPGMHKVAPEEITAMTTKIGDTGLQVESGASLEVAYKDVKNALQTIPEDTNIVMFGINDDVVAGGLRAIDEAGRSDRAMVGGIGSGPESRKQLRTNPAWVVEGEVFVGQWGEYIMAMAAAILQGATPPELTLTPQTVMTKETIDQYFDPNTDQPVSLPPLPPENEYLIPTGILQKFGNVEGLK